MTKKGNSITTTWIDPDDAPAWTAETFERAEFRRGEELVRPASGTLTKRGRPKLANPKRQVSIRLDADVIERLRESGPGWQGRVNEILKKVVGA